MIALTAPGSTGKTADRRPMVFVITDSPTPFDIRFRLFGFPCRVSGFFWLGATILGYNVFQDAGVPAFAVWVGCVFLSILVHELGHAFACRAFRARVTSVTLSFFGGYCSFEDSPRARWKRIAIALAGPAAGFLLLGFVRGLDTSTKWSDFNTYSKLAYHFFWWINLVWGFVNLLPIWPLDGGQVCREVCQGARIDRPVETSLWISIVLTATLAILSLLLHLHALPVFVSELFDWFPASLFVTLFMAMFAGQNYQALQQLRSEHRSTFGGPGFGYSDDDAPWRRR
jgi:Zn-dependent protease